MLIFLGVHQSNSIVSTFVFWGSWRKASLAWCPKGWSNPPQDPKADTYCLKRKTSGKVILMRQVVEVIWNLTYCKFFALQRPLVLFAHTDQQLYSSHEMSWGQRVNFPFLFIAEVVLPRFQSLAQGLWRYRGPQESSWVVECSGRRLRATPDPEKMNEYELLGISSRCESTCICQRDNFYDQNISCRFGYSFQTCDWSLGPRTSQETEDTSPLLLLHMMPDDAIFHKRYTVQQCRSA